MARPPAATAPPPPPPPPIDRLVWLACAAPLSRIPVVGTQVFYFPEGHAEQCPAPLPDPLPSAHRFFLCTITAVHLSADTTTGEPYATISLLPLRHDAPAPAPAELAEVESQEFRYYAKQLTQSDANNGGGFSVPRLCADHIFPALNLDDDPPVQSLTMGDLQGDSWEFRHIYRGTPRRHLLTTGWSKFVNAKQLVAGDTVVFMWCGALAPERKLLVGVRRAARYSGESACNARGRVQPQEVMEAVRLAAEQAAFRVTYYPRHGAGEFVVPRVEVDKGLTTPWRCGLQVRAQVMEAEDTRRLAWLNGTLTNLRHQQIWRTLEVEWDASAASSSMKNRFVNPWQVQPVDFPPLPMGLKISSNNISAPVCNGDSLLVPPKLMHPQPQPPADIQGARHNNGHAYADIPSSSTPSMVRSQQLFPRDLQILVPHTDIVTPQNGSPPNNPVNTPLSASDGMKTIQLFGVTITSPVQGDTNGAFASAQVNQVPEGVDDETATEEASDTSLPDSLTNGHNQDGVRL